MLILAIQDFCHKKGLMLELNLRYGPTKVCITVPPKDICMLIDNLVFNLRRNFGVDGKYN